MQTEPFYQVQVEPQQVDQIVNALLERIEHDKNLAAIFPVGQTSEQLAQDLRAYALLGANNCFSNGIYQVSKRPVKQSGDEPQPYGTFYHLSIKRIDGEVISDREELQGIKDALLGENCDAAELYPKESRVVDSANQYHLFGYEGESFRYPLALEGLKGWRKVSEPPLEAMGYRAFVAPQPGDKVFGLLRIESLKPDQRLERDWRLFQAIKNQVASRRCEAIEIYPAHDRSDYELLSDPRSTYLLFSIDSAFAFPFGMPNGYRSEVRLCNARNRPFTDGGDLKLLASSFQPA